VGAIQSYKDLVAWQKAMELAEAVYRCVGTLPKEEIYGLASQMRRAVVSVAANIAEGRGRNSLGESRQFLGIARGSLAELETEISIAERVGYLNEAVTKELQMRCAETGRVLNGLHKSLTAGEKSK